MADRAGGALPPNQPLPLAEAPRRRLAGVEIVLADIDDTLTSDGRLTAEAYGALEALQTAGLKVVPVTGRPAGWCDMIARFWPVDGVVGENGALAYHYERKTRHMVRRYWKDSAERKRDRVRLDRLAEEITAAVPGSAVANDQPFRLDDLAIDIAEDVPRLSEAAVNRIVALFTAAGARAKISSIHVNGWFGDYDKRGMSARVLEELFRIDINTAGDRVVFIGDSPNDEPLFAAFPLSVGVANLSAYLAMIEVPPAYITERPGGSGFAEFTAALLAARN